MTRARPEKAGPQQGGRDQNGKFQPGTSGNPNGRPKGSRHKVTLAVQALLDGEGEAVARKVIEQALDGDTVAQRLVLERIVPPKKDAPVAINLPEVSTSQDLVAASAVLLRAVAAGEITPTEAQAVAALLQGHGRVLEINDLVERIEQLERKD